MEVKGKPGFILAVLCPVPQLTLHERDFFIALLGSCEIRRERQGR